MLSSIGPAAQRREALLQSQSGSPSPGVTETVSQQLEPISSPPSTQPISTSANTSGSQAIAQRVLNNPDSVYVPSADPSSAQLAGASAGAGGNVGSPIHVVIAECMDFY